MSGASLPWYLPRQTVEVRLLRDTRIDGARVSAGSVIRRPRHVAEALVQTGAAEPIAEAAARKGPQSSNGQRSRDDAPNPPPKRRRRGKRR